MGEKRTVDVVIVGVVMALLSLGVVMVYSASSVALIAESQDAFYYLKYQALWAAVGLSGMYVASRVDYRHLERWANLLFVVNLILLVLVLVPGIGRVSHGARRWIGLGPLGVNPAEIMKFSFVLFLARYMSRRGEGMRRFWTGLLPPLVAVAAVFGLILLEPDLGTAVSLAGCVVIMIFAGGAKIGHLLGLGFVALPAFLWAVLGEEYRRRRLLAFVNPWADPQGSGYQIIQALYALGSGGLFGLGLGGSRQKFFYLPARHTDFIFAIIAEELGFLGAATVVALFAAFAWRGYRVAVRAPDTFGSLVAAGMTSMIGLQAVINIGVIVSLFPITGIPLPLISYGGSSLVFSLVGIGVLLSVSRAAR